MSGRSGLNCAARDCAAAGAESDINANVKDTHDWPEGVWTLPPVYRRGDKDREVYAAIGADGMAVAAAGGTCPGSSP